MNVFKSNLNKKKIVCFKLLPSFIGKNIIGQIVWEANRFMVIEVQVAIKKALF